MGDVLWSEYPTQSQHQLSTYPTQSQTTSTVYIPNATTTATVYYIPNATTTSTVYIPKITTKSTVYIPNTATTSILYMIFVLLKCPSQSVVACRIVPKSSAKGRNKVYIFRWVWVISRLTSGTVSSAILGRKTHERRGERIWAFPSA